MGLRLPALLMTSVVGLASAPALAIPMAKGQFTTSDTCGSCHKDIYRMWRASSHACSMEDNIFLEAYRAAEASDGAAVSRRCLNCHGPMIAVNGDVQLREKITWEGVSCDVCHSLIAVDLSGTTPRNVLDVGPVKRGPIRGAVSMAHEVAYSELHTRALVCAGCHEYVNGEGTGLITTYSEWKASAAAREGKTCQTCHMSRTHANVVDPKVKRVSGAEVNLHEMPGGHSLDQLHKALALSYEPKREGDTLIVNVAITNRGAGHAVPTGMPGRRVILEVTSQAGGEKALEERRVYSKIFQDAHGSIITRDSGYFGPGVHMDSDSRIKPGERRTELFQFPAPAAENVTISLKLHYEHAPTGGLEDRTWITFQSETRTLLPAKTAAQ